MRLLEQRIIQCGEASVASASLLDMHQVLFPCSTCISICFFQVIVLTVSVCVYTLVLMYDILFIFSGSHHLSYFVT